MQSLDASIVECNTAYGGSRSSTAMHYQVAEDHGYTAIAAVDIMDENGSMTLPVTGGSMWSADQACIDLVYGAEEGGSLVNRIESRNGLHTLEHAQDIGLGSREYRLVSIDG